MKQAYSLIFLLVIGLFFSFTIKSYDCNDIDYTILKIDSVNNWYLIYATRNDSVFKIASIKNNNYCCNRISVGRRYNFELQKRLENVLSKNGMKLLPVNYFDVTGVIFDNESDVFVAAEKGIFGLYSCKNLMGICIVH